MNSLFKFRCTCAILCCAAIAFQNGCSKEKMDELVSKAKETASDLSEKGGEALKSAKESASKIKDSAAKIKTGAGNLVSMNGKANFTIGTPIDFPASFLRVVPLPDGSHVVQMKSYKDGQEDSYPGFLIQGVTDQSSVDALSGQTVTCQLYAVAYDGGDVWTNVEGKQVAVQFQKTDNKMTASFSNASLVNRKSGSEAPSSGTFECVNLD